MGYLRIGSIRLAMALAREKRKPRLEHDTLQRGGFRVGTGSISRVRKSMRQEHKGQVLSFAHVSPAYVLFLRIHGRTHATRLSSHPRIKTSAGKPVSRSHLGSNETS